MSIERPRLDDADAAELLQAARAALARRGGGWSAADPADPGVALLEAFVHVTAQELRRLNRLPEAAHAEFLRMIGHRRRPAEAASTALQFALAKPRSEPTTIAAGTRVAAASRPDVVFSTLADAVIAAGDTVAEAPAAQVVRAAAQVVGMGDGTAGQRILLPHRPLPGAPAAAAEIRVAVAIGDTPHGPDDEVIAADGALFRVFHEVDYLPAADGHPVFAVDREAGELRFASDPAAAPGSGRTILAWYCWMETEETEPLSAGVLTEPVSPLPGVSVANPQPVAAGSPAESTEAAMRRNALAVLARGRAVVARDYEALALDAHPAVARAHAGARSERWRFAAPGTVEVLIAPKVPPGRHGLVSIEHIAERQAQPPALDRVVADKLAPARPLGATLQVEWIRMRPVGVRARVYAARGADRVAVARAVEERLNAFLSPLPDTVWPEGWPLGRALRLSEVIETVAATRGVIAVDRVALCPAGTMVGAVTSLAADCAQAGVWFAAVDGRVHRTVDDGGAWVVLADAPGPAAIVATHPARAGLVAVAARGTDGSSAVHVSADCGETFRPLIEAEGTPQAMLWADTGAVARLLLATDAGLFEAVAPGDGRALGDARPVLASKEDIGPLYALADHPDGRGGRFVAAARQGMGGVRLSADGGRSGSFVDTGLDHCDVRALAFARTDDESLWLLAGCARPMVAAARACHAARLDADTGTLGPWVPADAGWPAYGIAALATSGGRVLAATPSAGLVVGECADGEWQWRVPGSDAGLPLDPGGQGRAGLGTVATSRQNAATVMAGGDGPLCRSRDGGTTFAHVTDVEGTDRVAIPPDWAICPGRHDVEVVNDDR